MYQYNKDPQLQFEIEQFYYQEANLLDSRKFDTWLSLLADDLQYRVPGRYSPQRDLKKRETPAFLAADDELERYAADACPIREESKLILTVRVQRAFKSNAWGSNPPARTRRSVSNIQIDVSEHGDSFRVRSNLMLYYSRHRDDNHLYSAQRIDRLRAVGDSFQVFEREVIFDWNVIDVPTLGLLL